MATDFDEVSALRRMDVNETPGPFSRGGLASIGRQISKAAAKPKSDYMVVMENQARMHAFRSQLKTNEMEKASTLRREEDQLSNKQAKKLIKAKGKQERKSTAAKAEADLTVAQGRHDMTMAAHDKLSEEAGGISNRSVEFNPSTGGLKYGVPLKDVTIGQQMRQVTNDLPIAKRDDTPQNLEK